MENAFRDGVDFSHGSDSKFQHYLCESLRSGSASAPLELEAFEIASRFFGEPPGERP